MAPRKKPKGPCIFCGRTGSLSREHVIAQKLRDRLQIQGKVEEYLGDRLVGTWDTLAIVLPQVCVSCNTGWMSHLERRIQRILGPLLLGSSRSTSIILDPSNQATLATWAIKTSLLLTRKKFRKQPLGWIPLDNLDWLYRHRGADLPPPGARVWMGSLQTTDRPSSHQVALITDANGQPAAHCGTFSIGRVLFQVFCCPREHSDSSPEIETWLTAKGAFHSGLLQIAPASSALRWPPAAAFTVDDLPAVAGRLQIGLGTPPQTDQAMPR